METQGFIDFEDNGIHTELYMLYQILFEIFDAVYFLNCYVPSLKRAYAPVPIKKKQSPKYIISHN